MSGWWLASYLVLWALLAMTLLVLLVVLRQLGLIYAQGGGGVVRLHEGPALGSTIRSVEGFDEVSGRRLEVPNEEHPLSLLVFVSPECSLCEEAVRGAGPLARDNDVDVLVISDAEGEQNDSLRSAIEPPARFMASHTQHELLGIRSTPQALLVDGKGVVLEKTIVNRIEHMQELLDRAVARDSLTRA
jgi:methylamine dehydrogenase accessory protein MauD